MELFQMIGGSMSRVLAVGYWYPVGTLLGRHINQSEIEE